MRYLFLTESEAEDLKNQDFMKDTVLERRLNYEDVSKLTLKEKLCAGQLLDKIDFSPWKECASVRHLWTQSDGTSCGACAINNAVQKPIAKNLCTAGLNQDEIKLMLTGRLKNLRSP